MYDFSLFVLFFFGFALFCLKASFFYDLCDSHRPLKHQLGPKMTPGPPFGHEQLGSAHCAHSHCALSRCRVDRPTRRARLTRASSRSFTLLVRIPIFFFFKVTQKKSKKKRQIERVSSQKKTERPFVTCCACGTVFFASFLPLGSACIATKMSCAQ